MGRWKVLLEVAVPRAGSNNGCCCCFCYCYETAVVVREPNQPRICGLQDFGAVFQQGLKVGRGKVLLEVAVLKVGN